MQLFIRGLEPTVIPKIRYLDNLTTEEEVKQAIKLNVQELACEPKVLVTKVNSKKQKVDNIHINERIVLQA